MNDKVLGLRTTIYHVADIAQAKAWYSKAFQTEPYFDEPFYVGYNIGGFELGLQPQEGPAENKVESVVSYWGVEAILPHYNRLLELGASVHEAPQNVGGDITVASVKDPWGNIIGLICNPGFQTG
ncbi:MAG: VOC family protein [Williamsia sp.]|nr:VOC family protein [Williamsia sp.]